MNDNSLIIDNESNKLDTKLRERKIPIMDSLLQNSGYKFSHAKAIVLVLLVIGIEGIHLPMMSLLLIPLSIYFQMSQFEAEISSAMLFIGLGIGSLSLSKLSEGIGRKNSISVAMLFLTFTQLIMVFSETFIIFTVMRFLSGISIGIVVPLGINTLLEILPIKLRSFVLTSIWAGVGIGTALLYICMFIFMPNYQISGIKTVFLICWLYQLLVTIILYVFYVDSPRNYIIQGQIDYAFKVLEEILQISLNKETKKRIVFETIHGENEIVANTAGKIKTGLSFLFGNKHYYFTSISLSLLWLAISLSLYGGMLISSIAMRELDVAQNPSTILTIQFINSLGLFFSIFLGAYLSELQIFGRITTMALSWLLSFIASIFIWIIPTSLPYVSVILSFCFGIGNNVSVTYTAEVYPTKERDFAIGLFMSLTRIGGCISQFIFMSLVVESPLIPYYLLTIIYLVMVVITIFLPHETQGKPLDTDITNLSLFDRLFSSKEAEVK